ncbi:MAG: hypothetical protein O2979_03510 [Proteobacteria bacterium]|nr:hypothetical protein [Pseudomonadota bacterium]
MKILTKTAIAVAAAAMVAGCASSGGSRGQSDQEGQSNPGSLGETLYLIACYFVGCRGSGCPNDTTASTQVTNSTTSSGTATSTTTSETTPTAASAAPVTHTSGSAKPTTPVDAATLITPLPGAIAVSPLVEFSSWQNHRNGIGVTATGPGAILSTSRSGDGNTVSFALAGYLYRFQTATLSYEWSGGLRELNAYELNYVSRSGSSALSDQPGIDVAWSTSNAGRTAFTSTPTDGIALVANPFELGWDYQSFGVWTKPEGTTAEYLHANSFGSATPGAAVQSSGSATFAGKLAGMYVHPSGQGSMAAANLNVHVDFSQRTLNLASSGMSLSRDLSAVSAAPHLDVSGTLTYSPGSSSFTGTLVNAGGTMSGTSFGQFYGPAVQELGGMFVLHAPKGVEEFVGAYGAKR